MIAAVTDLCGHSRHGQNGLLCDFFDIDGITQAVVDTLSMHSALLPLRHCGRRTVIERFDLKEICLPAWLEMVAQVVGNVSGAALFSQQSQLPRGTLSGRGSCQRVEGSHSIGNEPRMCRNNFYYDRPNHAEGAPPKRDSFE